MVNTFLTNPDFKISARSLDRARLGKQRVEAYQILNLIEDIKLLSKLLEIDINPKKLKESIKNIYQAEKKLLWYIVIRKFTDNTKDIFRIDRQIQLPSQQIINVYLGEKVKNDEYVILNETIEYSEPKLITNPYPDPIPQPCIIKKYFNLEGEQVHVENIFQKSLPNKFDFPEKKTLLIERVVKLGFANHPAVRMWFWHTDALKDYINAHIDEWISRGYKNTMNRYEVPKEYEKPQWTLDEEFHRHHRAALLEKEIDRKEKTWYAVKEEFIGAGKFTGYVWPVN